MNKLPDLKNSVLIVAHPDDEVLWFSSLLEEIGKVIFVFEDYFPQPKLGAQRARAVAELPFKCVRLKISEAGTYGFGNWENPEISPFGLKLEDANSRTNVSESYERNYHSIHAQLKNHLSPEMTVFTHNPWGEYGHPDHVQIYRIADDLRAELGFNLFVSSYISSRSTPLARYYVDSADHDLVSASINPEIPNKIADIYKQYGCWTWAKDWVWDKEEWFLKSPKQVEPGGNFPSLTNSPLLRKIPSAVHQRLPTQSG